jgi:hypothetical protein
LGGGKAGKLEGGKLEGWESWKAGIRKRKERRREGVRGEYREHTSLTNLREISTRAVVCLSIASGRRP